MSTVANVPMLQICRVGTIRQESETLTVAGVQGITGYWIKEFAVGKLESYAERILLSLAPMTLPATGLHHIMRNNGSHVDDLNPYVSKLHLRSEVRASRRRYKDEMRTTMRAPWSASSVASHSSSHACKHLLHDPNRLRCLAST